MNRCLAQTTEVGTCAEHRQLVPYANVNPHNLGLKHTVCEREGAAVCDNIPHQMPRLAPGLLHRARQIDPLLSLVLRGTRDVASAKNELRWLREFVVEQQQQKKHPRSNSSHAKERRVRHELRRLCIDRSRGKPLQYIMGTEYFGDLEIACEPEVLIPRWVL